VSSAIRPLVLLLAGLCWIGACAAAPDARDIDLTWRTTPTLPVVGATTTAEIVLRDGARQPVSGARLDVEGHMSHPGMAPVIGTAREREAGVYQIEFQLPMAGDWIVLVRGTLADGRTLSHRVDIAGVRPAG
jgi:hypothetical protein